MFRDTSAARCLLLASLAVVAAPSGSPAFEANFAVDSELKQACFPSQNVPIQDAAPNFREFFKRLQKTNPIDKKIDLVK